MENNQQSLIDSLKQYRLNLSKEMNVPAYVIFHDKTIVDIINAQPKSIDELHNMKGLGPSKINKYEGFRIPSLSASQPARTPPQTNTEKSLLSVEQKTGFAIGQIP